MRSIDRIARELADALRDAAYTRKEEDKKRISQLQWELCQAVKAEDAADEKPPISNGVTAT